MKRVDSEQWTVDNKQTAPAAAPLSTNHYPLSTALIIGYGNPLRSDDGFGWRVARLLERELGGQDVGAPLVGALECADTRPAPTTAEVRNQSLHVEIITCHQLTPELAERLSQCRRAVFIDADAQGTPGDIHRRPLRPQASASSAFTHSCTPEGLLASAQQLYGHHPQAVVFTVSAQTFAFGESLSPVVAAALPKVVDQVCLWVKVGGATRVS